MNARISNIVRGRRGGAVLIMAGLAVLLAAGAALVIALVGGSSAPSATARGHLAECNGLGLDYAIMVYPFAGTYNFSVNGADYEITLSNASSASFDWQSDMGIDAVSVKSWWSANVYAYNEALNDKGLTANENEQVWQIYFCFDKEPKPAEEPADCGERKDACPTPEEEEQVPDKCTDRKGCPTPELID